MTDSPANTRPFLIRSIFPAVIVVTIMILSKLGYDFSRSINNNSLQFFVAHVTAILMFTSIWLGGLIANTMAFFLGASFVERIMICLVTPLIWSTSVMVQLYGIYPFGEFLFFLFHPLVLGCPVVALLCMSVSELWCRKIQNMKSAGSNMPMLEWKHGVLLLVSFSLAFLFLWEAGHFYVYNIYMKVHAAIFT